MSGWLTGSLSVLERTFSPCKHSGRTSVPRPWLEGCSSHALEHLSKFITSKFVWNPNLVILFVWQPKVEKSVATLFTTGRRLTDARVCDAVVRFARLI